MTTNRPESADGTRCTWCGAEIEREDGYRLAAPEGERGAAFCRLEHIVPWALQGPHWEAGIANEPAGLDEPLEACAQCGATLADTYLVLVRHRGAHRVPDGFCSVDHLRDWAKGGGRWRGVES